MATFQGPKRGLSQEIGQDAESALSAHRPERWSLGPIGGADYGIDFELTIFGEQGGNLVCNLQLKGTTQTDARLKDGLHISHGFDCTTLNLWHASFTPILIAVADLIDSRNPLKATVHYLFVSPDLDDILSDVKAGQTTVNIRIPRANLINRDLDVLPVIRSYLDELKDARKIVRERRLASGGTAEASTSLSVASQSTAIASFDLAPAASAIEDLVQTTDRPDELRAALMSLRNGDVANVLRLTQKPSDDQESSPTITIAIEAYLRAKALEFLGGDAREVSRLLRVASAVLSDNDDIRSAVAQQELDEIPFGSSTRSARDKILASLLPHKGPSVATVIAKIQALNGEFDAARLTLEDVPRPKADIARLVVSIVEGDWQGVLAQAQAIRQLATLTQVQHLLVDLMEARAHFQMAMGPMSWPEEGELAIPAAGVAGMNIEALRRAYNTSLAAMYKAQVLRWPAITNQMLDVFSISATVLGRTDEALPILASLGRARAADVVVRETVIKFALNADQPSLALQLSDLAGASQRFPNESALLATASCKVGDVARAFSIVGELLSESTPQDDTYFATLMTVGVSADAAMRDELLTQIRERMGGSEQGRDFLAILDSAISVGHSVLRRTDAVKKLHSYWRENGKSAVISRHLLVNADPGSEDEAAIISEVASHLQEADAMDAEQWASYGQALITLRNYSAAIAQLRAACERFSLDHRLSSLLAIALELNGDAHEAYLRFEKLIESGEASESARRYFINSAARMGFFEQAEAQVRSALAKSTNRRARLRHLNTLFQLALLSSASPEQMWVLAWQYGELADQNDEKEEGAFLQEIFAALNTYQPQNDDPRLVEYARRREAFVKQFPDSKLLRKVDLPVDGPPQSIVRALRDAMGITEDDLHRMESIERGMNSGSIVIPFSWRPKRFLREVSDVLALWQLRRTKATDCLAWHFNSAADDLVQRTPDDPSGWECVLSLTSLLVLDECGLLQRAIDAFDRVIIARATLIALQDSHNPITSGYGRDIASRILEVLRTNFGKMVHPPLPAQIDEPFGPNWHQEEVVAMAVRGRIYFCDDVIEAAFVCGVEAGANGVSALEKPSMCTVDLLNWLDQQEKLSPQDVAQFIGKLIEMKIGVNVSGRILIAAIPERLQEATSYQGAEVAISESHTFCMILDGVWRADKPFQQLLTHFAAVMSYLVLHGASDAVLEAMWARWLQSVRLQTRPAIMPLDKLAISFCASIVDVNDDGAVLRLWRAYWRAIEFGTPDVINVSPDRTGVEAVARILGRASVEHGPQVSGLSQRARRALGAGMELDALYERIYVEAAVEASKDTETKLFPLFR